MTDITAAGVFSLGNRTVNRDASHYGCRLEPPLDLLRPAELDFLIGLRAGLLATAFLAVALREDFAAGFLAAAVFTDRFGLPRGLAAACLGFLTTFAAASDHRALHG